MQTLTQSPKAKLNPKLDQLNANLNTHTHTQNKEADYMSQSHRRTILVHLTRASRSRECVASQKVCVCVSLCLSMSVCLW